MLTQNIFLKSAICIIIFACVTAQDIPCNLRETAEGSVCVCNSTYCDYLADPTPENEVQFTLVSSSKAGLRFKTTRSFFHIFKTHYIIDHDQRQQTKGNKRNKKYTPVHSVVLNINRDIKFRKIVGFGGALTGTVSHLLQKLPQALQDHFFRSFYSTEGIAWNLLRMSIGSSDFDLEPWAYNEFPENDPYLTNFTELDARDKKKVEQIHRLKKVADLNNLRVYGSAWSPPTWMKSNRNWIGLSNLKKEYYQTWADYHLKWLNIMEKSGVPVWALSTGNKPMSSSLLQFMSLIWSPIDQAVWLTDYLGPALRQSNYKDLIIFGNDDQRYTLPKWYNLMRRSRRNSLDYIDALGVHYYWDDYTKPSLIDQTLKKMPEKMLLITESCISDKPWKKYAPALGSWHRGEKYAKALLENLQYGYNGWIDWNLILDQNGGPNFVHYYADAPVIVNTNNTNEFLKQPMFYAMGHFSKFIPENSVRIEAIRSNDHIECVAYLRPDNSVAAILFNSDNAQVEISIEDSVRGFLALNLPPRSLHTLIYR